VDGKDIYKSWTIIFNTIILASDVAMMVANTGLLPPGVASGIALANLLLRGKTKEPLKLPWWK